MQQEIVRAQMSIKAPVPDKKLQINNERILGNNWKRNEIKPIYSLNKLSSNEMTWIKTIINLTTGNGV